MVQSVDPTVTRGCLLQGSAGWCRELGGAGERTEDPAAFFTKVGMAGSNLPAQLGPWQSAGAGTVATSYAETNLDGLALSDPVMRAIKQDGFYLTRSGVTDIVTLDKVASTDDRRIKDAVPDYAQWLPILRNQLKDMDFSRIRHVLAFVVTNGLMH